MSRPKGSRPTLEEMATEARLRRRAEQGLPPTVEDPLVLDKVVTLLGLANPQRRGRRAA